MTDQPSQGARTAEDFAAMAEQWQERYAEVRTRVAATRVTGSSPDGGVRVDMAAGANIVGIHFTEDALRQPPASLEVAVMAAIGQASRQMAQTMQEAVGPFLGGFDATALASGGLPGGLGDAFERDFRRRQEAARAGEDPSAPLPTPSAQPAAGAAPTPGAASPPATAAAQPPAPQSGAQQAATPRSATVPAPDGTDESTAPRRPVPPPNHGPSRVDLYDEEDDA